MLPALSLAGALAFLAPPWFGVAVTPYSQDPDRGLTFDGMVDDIAALGASDVAVVVQWSQASVRSNQIMPHPKQTQDEAVVRGMMRRARQKGLRVMLFPILWVEQRGPNLWRGTLSPENPGLWWATYRTFVLHFADLAREEGAVLFSVGSELGSMEGDASRWRDLIAAVRARFPGKLVYSANWDHYADVPFWDALDYIGLTGYHRLAAGPPPAVPSQAELDERWAGIRTVILDWREHRHPGRPLLFTEVGYPSLQGAAWRPWEYTLGGDVDLEEQRRCWLAFARAWAGDSGLAGFYAWNWWGVGGPDDGNYTPRHKPAEGVLRAFFGPKR